MIVEYFLLIHRHPGATPAPRMGPMCGLVPVHAGWKPINKLKVLPEDSQRVTGAVAAMYTATLFVYPFLNAQYSALTPVIDRYPISLLRQISISTCVQLPSGIVRGMQAGPVQARVIFNCISVARLSRPIIQEDKYAT